MILPIGWSSLASQFLAVYFFVILSSDLNQFLTHKKVSGILLEHPKESSMSLTLSELLLNSGMMKMK